MEFTDAIQTIVNAPPLAQIAVIVLFMQYIFNRFQLNRHEQRQAEFAERQQTIQKQLDAQKAEFDLERQANERQTRLDQQRHEEHMKLSGSIEFLAKSIQTSDEQKRLQAELDREVQVRSLERLMMQTERRFDNLDTQLSLLPGTVRTSVQTGLDTGFKSLARSIEGFTATLEEVKTASGDATKQVELLFIASDGMTKVLAEVLAELNRQETRPAIIIPAQPPIKVVTGENPAVKVIEDDPADDSKPIKTTQEGKS